MKQYFINRVTGLLSRVALSCLQKEFEILTRYDANTEKYIEDIEPRIYLQIRYKSQCNKTGEEDMSWKGRKWYLSEHMTNDEIIKTAYAAFEACVLHEVREGFLVDKKILFNPHVDFEELLKISSKEIKRKEYVSKIQ